MLYKRDYYLSDGTRKKTRETAFEVYKQRKHEIAVMLANKHRQVLRYDVYNILMNYYPDIND